LFPSQCLPARRVCIHLLVPEEDLGNPVFDLIVAAVELVVGDGEVEEGGELLPGHDIEDALVLLFQLYELDALEVAVVLGDVLEDVLVSEVGQEGRVVPVLPLEPRHLLARKQPADVRVVLVGEPVECALAAQRPVEDDLMAEVAEHVGDAHVGLPGGQVAQGVHVLVDLEEGQRVQLGSLPEQLPLEHALVVEEPQVLLEVLVAQLVRSQQETVVFAVQVVAEGHRDHPHLLQLVETLQVRHCALRVAQQVCLDAACHVREGLAVLQELLRGRGVTRLS
jgi:hypothetical protein